VTHYRKKKLFGQRKSVEGRLARTLSVSFYPLHICVLETRERELNVHRSILLQVLLEIEERDMLLRRELIARLTSVQTGPPSLDEWLQRRNTQHPQGQIRGKVGTKNGSN
jgi:hypothetical protein